MWKVFWLVVPLGSFVLLAACASTPTQPPADPFQVRKLPEEMKAAADSVVVSNNRFAVDLYRQLGGQGNAFFSPFSVSTALAMTSAGAAGTTLAEMRNVLRFEMSPDRLHPAYGAILTSLDRGVALGGYELRTANRLWGQAGYGFLDEFIKVTRDAYAAPLEEADFVNGFEAARLAINRWVEEQTAKRIQELFAPGTINADTRLALVNAIYFKGLWADQFDRALTKDKPFRVTSDLSVTVPMMTREGTYPFTAADGVQILEMPYRGGDLSMIVLLPDDPDGIEALGEQLTSERLAGWLGTLQPQKIIVNFPRFRIESEYTLNDHLSAMGMASAFDANRADFSAMNGRRDLFISIVVHKGFVEVNEEGTEAAAATGVGVSVTSMPPAFDANHPFLFFIRDNVTGSLLFMGRVVNPAA